MKKAMSAVLAGAVFATSFGITQPVFAQDTAKTPTVSVQQSNVNAVYNQYLDILQRYKLVQDKGFPGPDMINLGLNGILTMSSYDKTPLSYALVDIAHDGSPELIFAKVGLQYNDKLNQGGYKIYDMFGNENGTIKRLFNIGSMGYRHIFTLRESGMVAEVILGGSSYNYTQFHNLNINSYSPKVSHFVLQTGWLGEVPKYYRGTTDLNSYYAINESEYNSLRNQYGYIQNINWHPLDDYASLWNELNATTIPVYINGLPIEFDQQPVNENGRVLVPLRGIFEALGAEVYWDNASRSIISNRGDINLIMTIDSNTMYKNGVAQYLDVPPKIINDRTMVPLRVIGETFGCNVLWENNAVYISTQ